MKLMVSKKDWQLIKMALQYIKPLKFRFAAAFLLLLTGVGLDILQPLVGAKVLACLFEKNINSTIMYVKFTLLLYLLRLLVSPCQTYLLSFLSENIIFNLKKDMYNKVINLPIKAFDEKDAGEFISRLNGDAITIANVFTNQLLTSTISILRVIFVGSAMFMINIQLAVIVVASFPFSYIITSKFGKILRKKSTELAKLNDKYYSYTNQSVLGIREINGLGVKMQIFKGFVSKIVDLKNSQINISVIGTLGQTLSQSINIFSQFMLTVIGVYLVFKGNIKVEVFIAFTAYSEQFSSSLINLIKLNIDIQRILTSLERVFHLMDNLSYKSVSFGELYLKQLKGAITFEKVNFEYKENCPIIKDVSFEIKPKSKTAIVGTSGSGKTTLFNLLLKFYEIDTGRILIDNININRFNEKVLREQISVVRQEPFLFNKSIRDNLFLANFEATEQEMVYACKSACIHEFIMELPKGYDSILGENGTKLSCGQKQRIAIARAILKKSKIILFDEATSSLDNESQYFIRKAIDNISKNHTVIMIAHRLSTIITCDSIIVVEHGKIAGQGNHASLLRNNALYRRLYKKELLELEVIKFPV